MFRIAANPIYELCRMMNDWWTIVSALLNYLRTAKINKEGPIFDTYHCKSRVSAATRIATPHLEYNGNKIRMI